jgi:hypothetical protein
MPTRKQRRRRQKELRHEWEEVYVDEEGRELAPEEVEELAPPGALAKKDTEPRAKAKGTARRQPAGAARGARVVQPPSWRRALKRTAIFAPLMYVFITLTNRSVAPLYALLITLQLILLFLPFSYLMDSLTYRLWKKRQAPS